MAEDTVDLAAELGLNSPVILGHSMGGKTAMTAALAKVCHIQCINSYKL